ncbi:flagellar transcriptional regulator FlhC [Halomonas elongata]|uniref:Flagellar transcriptional regulator FlhC n=2 Tax=Halomonas elongata TaxID=2746 RepID=E1VBS2_HALED|nr:flagellar transcriptional regulator FlhC [Halomonas elongata]MBW5800212.1 flagellar transcriptional regulator FlhC [Halomonas elongata]MDL4860890.1 flagellar transcriptional regulator FlhC [Halomonas elongata]OBX35427.1 flagellar transcriptional regulator FlhC [Halomonas elongata]RAW06726.1 flagellar transcriptional regulator FlhC [Halomonas elongata]WBF17994.1 flagellar transcriptional regulator FlhC [Halomonas elongata]
MSAKSLLDEWRQVRLAIDLIELGARLQVLETETDLSRARLIRLFKEVRGMSPPKGMLPFSTDWFITWMPNIHSSLFYNIYLRLRTDHGCSRMEGFIKAYRLYLEQVAIDDAEAVLGLTRAWTLVRFFESEQLQLSSCTRCRGRFVAHAHSPTRDYVCGICQPPSRAGKSRKRRERVDAVSRVTSPLGTPNQA